MQVRDVRKDLRANTCAEVDPRDVVERRELKADACGDLEQGAEAAGAGYCYREEFEEAAGAASEYLVDIHSFSLGPGIIWMNG
jgi:hypothetical protein